MKRIVVAVTGASGSPYAVRLLQALSCAPEVETHLIVSRWAERVLKCEAGIDSAELDQYCVHRYDPDNLAARISSGSFLTYATVIVPCSMKTASAIANGFAADLISRVADITIKERRLLIVVPRETPLSTIHLRNLLTLAEAGALVLPPVPAFYHNPASVQDIIDQTVARILDHLGIEQEICARWDGGDESHADEKPD